MSLCRPLSAWCRAMAARGILSLFIGIEYQTSSALCWGGAVSAQEEIVVRSHRVLVASCLALATVVSAVASLNVALPEVARDTGASQTELAWIVDAYALVFAALLLPAGALGDRFGRRTALVTGLLVFLGAAGVAMLVDSPGWLIACRCGLGLGAALVMPATLSTITSTFEALQL